MTGVFSSRWQPLHDEGLLPHANSLGTAYAGTADDDFQNGTSGDDEFDFWQGGNDTLNGEGGNDTFVFKGAFTADDSIDGSTGNDTLILHGDYREAAEWTDSTLQNVETIVLQASAGYALGLTDGNVGAGATLTIDAHTLKASASVSIDGGSELDGTYVFTGGDEADTVKTGTGNDTISTGGGNDRIDPGTGNDTVHAGNGNDVIAPADFGASDSFDGGKGNDTVNATYGSGGLTVAMQATTLTGIENLNITDLLVSDTATLTMNDANVAAGATLNITVYGDFGATPDVHINGMAETNGHFNITTDAGDDQLSGGDQSDTFHIEAGGDDTVYGGDGADIIYAGAAFDANDNISGDEGSDTLVLDGDYSAGLDLTASQVSSLEKIVVAAGHSYHMEFGEAMIHSGTSLEVDGSSLGKASTLFVDDHIESSGSLTFDGGRGADSADGGSGVDNFMGSDGNDTLNGNDGDDSLYGGDGNDMLTGGTGSDTLAGVGGKDLFVYNAVSESTGSGYDDIVAFDPTRQNFVVPEKIKGISATVTHGRLDTANFNHNLKAAIGGHELSKAHAVLFTPDQGNLAGHTFLIVDANGTAGYQANADYVILLSEAANLGALSASNFIRE